MTMLLHCCSMQGLLCPTWQSYAGLPPKEGACVTCFPSRPLSFYNRNDSVSMTLSAFHGKFLREVVKKGCLCNINVWRRKSGNSMEGFDSHLPCISRIFRPECSFGRRKTTNPCIQVPDFPPRLPGARRSRNGFCRFVKKYDHQTKTRIPSLAA